MQLLVRSSLSSVPHLSYFLFLSALAAVSCLRSLAGFGFPLFAPAMFGALGYGKGCSVLAGVAIVIGCPAYVYVCVVRLDVRFDSLLFFLSWQTVDFLEVWETDTNEQHVRAQR